MNCPSCNSSLEQNARFCGVCGFRLQTNKPAAPAVPSAPPAAAAARPNPQPAPVRVATPVAEAPKASPQSPPPQKAPPIRAPKPKPKGDEIYLNQVLNNRFKVESKIGEGGFGAVYRGVQLATGRKVALKLLHPEMTKDENLVARFRREGMVLCNLRDAHTITTYDFDQTPDGTLYIAMELLEGKSLHHVFHEQAPLEWKRMFKILTEMCSSLAEAHAQGIVHRDLKPENVYLESRPGNPEFVKILDFGIAKVMRGDTIDPQSPQLTATGQTLGTLEYMSPEQLMGKPLDGRSDVYALGVVAYEMITGRLPFPDAKGPAGLITAQLKQTPIPPSHANPAAGIPPAADRVILKCLEKDKNNRHADVTQLAVALQEVVAQAGAEAALSAGQSGLVRRPATPEVFDEPAASMMQMPMQGTHAMGHAGHPMSASPGPMGASATPMPGTMPGQMPGPMGHMPGPMGHMPGVHAMGHAGHGAMSTAVGHAGHDHADPRIPTPPPVGGLSYASNMGGAAAMPQMYAQAPAYPPPYAPQTQVVSTTRWIWWIVALLALGAGVGAVLALAMR